MINVAKYLLQLESLDFAGNSAHQDRLSNNVDKLLKFCGDNLTNAINRSIHYLDVSYLQEQIKINDTDVRGQYVILLQHVLLNVVEKLNFNSDAKEDLISTRHLNLCIEAVQDLADFALKQQLHPLFCRKGVFAAANSEVSINYELLQLSVAAFTKFLQIKQFHAANAMQDVLRYYMAANYTLILGQQLHECALDVASLSRLQQNLNCIWQNISKLEYFRNILLLKGIQQLPVELQKQLHKDLLQKLASKDGFATLVATLQVPQQSGATPSKQTYEVIANIVAFRGHSLNFQRQMLTQVFAFLKLCLHNEAMAEHMGAGLLSLRRLYDLNASNRALVEEALQNSLQQLIQPADLLTGLVVMEHKEFCELVSLHFQLFCTSAVECLPSELLTVYLPLWLQLYYNIPPLCLQKQQIGKLIMRCLNNRVDAELQQIVEQLYTQKFPSECQTMHTRLLLLPSAEQTELCLKVASADYKQEYSISLALPEVLMNEEFHVLTYRIFMILLRLLSRILLQEGDETQMSRIDLLQTEEELISYLNSKYPVKVEVLLSLNTLISHAPLKTQISTNAKDFLYFLRESIAQRVSMQQTQAESHDQMLLLLLTLMQELLEHTQADSQDFLPILRQLRRLTANQLVQQRADILISLLSGDNKFEASSQTASAAYQQARTLIESAEPHLQVYGIQLLLDLLRRRDPVTLTHVHVIVALALHTLKSNESYTFLNCVRLFVALVHVMEAEVLELLAGEYLNERASIDFRLVVGEALLKVGQEMGPLCYKYKDVLLNCFMQGVRCTHNEFRMSAFSNLGQLCRTLSYQVHKYFHELLSLIDSELTTTTTAYLPAQRAAVLVLSDLLEGMDNLWDFEEMLLPIYRVLKALANNEQADDKLRQHAANGLHTLAVKCKRLLCPEERLEKEIQILGIKDKPKGKSKAHILELN